MYPSSYGVLAELFGEFWGNSTYYESPSLSPDLAAGVISLSGLECILGVTVGPSVGCAWFEFILLLLVAAGVVVIKEKVSVSTSEARASPARVGKADHPTITQMMGCVHVIVWVKYDLADDLANYLTASVVFVMFWFTLVMRLGAVGDHYLSLGGGMRVSTLLQQFF